MHTFNVTGYAVNKRGLTVGVTYQVEATDAPTARNAGLACAQARGMAYARILHVVPAPMSDDHQQGGQHHA